MLLGNLIVRVKFYYLRTKIDISLNCLLFFRASLIQLFKQVFFFFLKQVKLYETKKFH